MTFEQKQDIKAILVLIAALAMLLYGIRGMMQMDGPEVIAQKILEDKNYDGMRER